jgi:hypothetical protein
VTAVTPASGGPYDVDVPAMLLQRHGRDIHALFRSAGRAGRHGPPGPWPAASGR